MILLTANCQRSQFQNLLQSVRVACEDGDDARALLTSMSTFDDRAKDMFGLQWEGHSDCNSRFVPKRLDFRLILGVELKFLWLH